MKWFFRGLPHVTIVLSLMTLTFFCIDRVNRSMAFMTSEMSKWVFAALAVGGLLSALALITCHWREDAREARHELRMQAKQRELAEKLFSNHEYIDEPDTVKVDADAGPMQSQKTAGEDPHNTGAEVDEEKPIQQSAADSAAETVQPHGDTTPATDMDTEKDSLEK